MNIYLWVALGLFLNMFLFDRIPLFRYLLTPIAGATLAVFSFPAAFFGMMGAVWFVKWDTVPTAGSYRDDPTVPKIIRGDLPRLLSYFETPDERCPCNSFEPDMMVMLEKYGRTFTTYWNLGVRNQMMGLAAALGKPTTAYAPEGVKNWKRGDVWAFTIPLPFYSFVGGWQIYRKLDDTFLAVPVGTLKRN
jgi:hypothetical protein